MKLVVNSYEPPSIKPIQRKKKWYNFFLRNDWVVTKPGELSFAVDDKVQFRMKWRNGFKTDGGSIPRIFWFFTGHPLGEWLRDFLCHDGLYGAERLTRRMNDLIFYHLLKEHGCPFIIRWFIFLFVRIFGYVCAYWPHTRESILENSIHCPLWVNNIPAGITDRRNMK